MDVNATKVILVGMILAALVLLAIFDGLDQGLESLVFGTIVGHVLADGRTFLKTPPMDVRAQHQPPEAPK